MEEINGGNKVRKVLFNEVSLAVALVSLAFGVYFTFANPQKESDANMQKLQAEVEQHEALQQQQTVADEKFKQDVSSEINAIRTGDFKDVQRQLSDQAAQIVDLRTSITELKTIINERIPQKK